MKKILSFTLAMCLLLTLAACAASAPTSTAQPNPTIATPTTGVITTAPTTATTIPTIPTIPATTVPVPPTTVPVRTEPKAPDFTVYDLDGNPVKLSDFRGKPVILNFWASWCPPCKAEMPDFEEKYAIYGENIQFLMINLTDGSNETVDTAASFISKMGYTFPVFFDTDYSAVYAYNIRSIPTTYFIDAEGYIMNSTVGMLSAQQLQQGIDLLLP